VLLATTFVFSGVLGLGPALGSPVLVLVVLIAAPLALGALVDVLYVPPPEEYDLPETTE
jgi:multisubunit Na+/H+ antiporter MnhG subunit